MESPYKYSNTPTTLVKADPLQRFVAYFIDGLIGAVPVIIFASLRMYSLMPIGQLVAIAYVLTKDALPEVSGYLGGQSIGKKIMNIKAVKEATGESLLGDYGTAITRQISLLIPIFNLVDMLMVFSDDRKRFGDKWAKTIVVKA